jgi:ABC-2 type transport system permease protein
MKGFYTALNIEFIKVRKSKVLWITIIFFVFISVMLGFLMLVAKHPEIAKNSAIISTKASFIGKTDWPSYLGLLVQFGMALAFVGAGIVTVWIFGREYSDRTIKDILALPVSRISVVSAKFLIAFVWSFLLLVIMFFVSVLSGFAINLEGWSAQLFAHSCALFAETALLTLILLTPVAFITSVSRGYLLPFGFIILTMIVTQFVIIGLKFISPYFPWAIPALITGVAGPSNPAADVISWIILWTTAILGFAGTALWWRYADQH